MKKLPRLNRGMGIGGWLTNYKHFNLLPKDRRLCLTVGDMEHFETYITEADIAYIASLGMDHVRLGFDQIVVEDSPFSYRESIVDILRRFVDWCDKYSLRPLLSMHKALGNYCDILDESGLMQIPELQERFIAVWAMMEDVFAGQPDVAFELLNEVVNATDEEWYSLAERTIAAIRSKNANRLIILGCPGWGNPPGLNTMRVYDDANTIYTFHCYAPHEFTHQHGVLQAPQLFYNRKVLYPCDDIERYRDFHRVVNNDDSAYADLTRMDIGYLRQYLQPAFDFIQRYPDKILWCGEFGTIRHANITWLENWMRDMISLLKKHDIPYCVWNYLSMPNDGNRFSLVDDDHRRILSNDLAKIIRGDL